MAGEWLALVRRLRSQEPMAETVSQRVAQWDAVVDQRLAASIASQNIPYPPTRLALIGFKANAYWKCGRRDKDGNVPITNPTRSPQPRKPEPKLRQGDGQCGDIIDWNPNSSTTCHYGW